MTNPSDLVPRINEILGADLPDIEKLTQAFGYIIQQHIDITQRECELHKALGDMEGLIKLQIQSSTMEYMLGVFLYCHHQVTGKKVSSGKS
jgi:hypothetical protein